MNIETSRQQGKTVKLISSMPSNPNKHIYWVVYNKDMVEYTERLIKEVKGTEYFEKHVSVVAKSEPSCERSNGTVYFDPSLLDLIGNGGYG